mmetsp:Transcript_44223/g.144894  ORF Transcript_44223/g.144894 Transcript_44223/m.144894 type:complete len:261 (+) Transcript_44223:1-783(+)
MGPPPPPPAAPPPPWAAPAPASQRADNQRPPAIQYGGLATVLPCGEAGASYAAFAPDGLISDHTTEHLLQPWHRASGRTYGPTSVGWWGDASGANLAGSRGHRLAMEVRQEVSSSLSSHSHSCPEEEWERTLVVLASAMAFHCRSTGVTAAELSAFARSGGYGTGGTEDLSRKRPATQASLHMGQGPPQYGGTPQHNGGGGGGGTTTPLHYQYPHRAFPHPPGVCPPGMGPTAEATFGEGGAMDCDGVAQAWGDDFLGPV